MESYKKFGETLRIKRLEVKISLRTLSKKTGIDVAYLSRIERNGKPPIKSEIINKIVNVLNCSEEEIQHLKDLAALENNDIPEDINIPISNFQAIPVLLRTINSKKLSATQIQKLAERINEEY